MGGVWAGERNKIFTLGKCGVKSGGPTQSSLPPSLAAAPFSGILTISAAAVLHMHEKLQTAYNQKLFLQPTVASAVVFPVPLGSHLLILISRLAWC